MDNQDEHAVQLPEQPVDPTVHLPPALAFPPNEAAVFQAIKYLEEVRHSAKCVTGTEPHDRDQGSVNVSWLFFYRTAQMCAFHGVGKSVLHRTKSTTSSRQ